MCQISSIFLLHSTIIAIHSSISVLRIGNLCSIMAHQGSKDCLRHVEALPFKMHWPGRATNSKPASRAHLRKRSMVYNAAFAKLSSTALRPICEQLSGSKHSHEPSGVAVSAVSVGVGVNLQGEGRICAGGPVHGSGATDQRGPLLHLRGCCEGACSSCVSIARQ